MNTKDRFRSNRAVGFRSTLRSSIPYNVSKKVKSRWFRYHCQNWTRLCDGLKDLYETFDPHYQHLRAFSEFGHVLVRCPPMELYRTDRGSVLKVRPGQPSARFCNQPRICPWCSTRQPVRTLRSIFRRLHAAPAELTDGFEWHAHLRGWSLGELGRATPAALEATLDGLTADCERLRRAVYRNLRTRALVVRLRAYPGAPDAQGVPPLLVTARALVLATPDSPLAGKHLADWEPPGAAPLADFDAGPSAPGGKPEGFAACCRFLARYPAPLSRVHPAAAARLLALAAAGRRKRKTLFRTLHRSLPPLPTSGPGATLG